MRDKLSTKLTNFENGLNWLFDEDDPFVNLANHLASLARQLLPYLGERPYSEGTLSIHDSYVLLQVIGIISLIDLFKESDDDDHEVYMRYHYKVRITLVGLEHEIERLRYHRNNENDERLFESLEKYHGQLKEAAISAGIMEEILLPEGE